jgi:proteasome lid subunit RPN8/RPN11
VALAITQDGLARITQEARSRYPHECCGLLVGDWRDGRKLAGEIVPVENARRDSPHNRYLIPPEAFLRAQKAAEARHLDVVGFYHSHPDLDATPSESDRAYAWPGYSYVIVSVCGGTTRETRAWIVEAEGAEFREEGLEVLDGAGGAALPGARP